MTMREALAFGRARLASVDARSQAGCDDAASLKPDTAASNLDAALLLGHAMGLDRAKVLAFWRDALTPTEEATYRDLLDRRAAGISTAVLTGHREFYGLDFFVNDQVLVPRPETELLVEKALIYTDSLLRAPQNAAGAPETKDGSGAVSAPGNARGHGAVRCLDLCTGSGCIAVSLKHERPQLELHAADLSPAALEVARENARRILGSDSAIHFCEGDLFAALAPALRAGAFDLIVSNPPYVPPSVIPGLATEVQNEPHMALDGGGVDGLDIIRRLVPAAFAALKQGGCLLLEAGGEQAPAIATLLAAAGFTGITCHQDLAGIPRVTEARRP